MYCWRHLLPTCNERELSKAELTSNSTLQADTIISLAESEWSEKLFLQGDLVSLIHVPKALQQGSSRDDFPEFISPSRQAPRRVYTKTAGGRARDGVVQLDGPKSHHAHHSGPTNVHTIPPHLHQAGSMGFIWRLPNFHPLKWYTVIKQLLSSQPLLLENCC